MGISVLFWDRKWFGVDVQIILYIINNELHTLYAYVGCSLRDTVYFKRDTGNGEFGVIWSNGYLLINRKDQCVCKRNDMKFPMSF